MLKIGEHFNRNFKLVVVSIFASVMFFAVAIAYTDSLADPAAIVTLQTEDDAAARMDRPFAAMYSWRLSLVQALTAVLEWDALPPSVSGAMRTWRDYMQTGFELRMGRDLDSDFCLPRISPGLTVTDAYTPTRPLVSCALA